MASLTFSASVMDDICAALRQARQHQRTPLAVPLAKQDHDGDSMLDDLSGVCESVEHESRPCASAQHLFESWVQDLDDQTLPEMDSDELRILHALLFGAGDDAFAVADELLTASRS